MSKSTIFKPSYWTKFSNNLKERASNPQYAGELKEQDIALLNGFIATGEVGSEKLGITLRLQWGIDLVNQTILDAKFTTNATPSIIAAADVVAQISIGKSVDEVMKITSNDIEMALRDETKIESLDEDQIYATIMAYDAIKKTVAAAKGLNLSDFEDEMIVCHCAGVSLSTIQEVIKLNDLKTVEQITQYTKAGAFCGSCKEEGGEEKREKYLVDILKETRALIDEERANSTDESDDFESMSLVQKIKAIDAVIDDSVRQFLVMDGGNMEVIDVKDSTDYIDVYIRYLGACSSCASSTTGTLFAIEAALKEKLTNKIRVLPI